MLVGFKNSSEMRSVAYKRISYLSVGTSENVCNKIPGRFVH